MNVSLQTWQKKIPPPGGIFFYPARGGNEFASAYRYGSLESFSFAFSTSELDGYVLTSLL